MWNRQKCRKMQKNPEKTHQEISLKFSEDISSISWLRASKISREVTPKYLGALLGNILKRHEYKNISGPFWRYFGRKIWHLERYFWGNLGNIVMIFLSRFQEYFCSALFQENLLKFAELRILPLPNQILKSATDLGKLANLLGLCRLSENHTETNAVAI